MTKSKTSKLERLFSGYLQKKPEESASIWSRAFVSFDANVLLNLYRYSDVTSSEFVHLLKSMSGKIFITNQAFLEYLRNKHTVISAQMNLYDTKAIDELKKVLDDRNTHPFISSSTSSLFDSFYESLKVDYETARKKLSTRFQDDDIYRALEDLFEESIQEGFSCDYLKEKIFPEGKIRYAEKIPPGYDDLKDKGSDNSFEGLRRLYGDLIVWFEIIEYAKTHKKDVVFVTGDRKSDWWKSVSGKTVSARPELSNEFFRETGQKIIIYTPEMFLEYSSRQQDSSFSKDVIEEVRQLDEIKDRNYFWARTNLTSDIGAIRQRMLNRQLKSRVVDSYPEVTRRAYNKRDAKAYLDILNSMTNPNDAPLSYQEYVKALLGGMKLKEIDLTIDDANEVDGQSNDMDDSDKD